MRLSFYIARRFGMMFLMVTAVFAGILLMIDVIDQLRSADTGLKAAAYLSLLNLPESLYQILPLVMLLTSIALFLALARSSELVVVRAAGRSGLRFLLAPVFLALLIGAFGVSVFNPLVAATSKTYERLKLQSGAEASVFSISKDGLWMRQGNGESQSVINASKSNAAGNQLLNVSFLTFDVSGEPTRRIEAQSARLEGNNWVLAGVKLWDLRAANPEQVAQTLPSMNLPTDLTLSRIANGFGEPATIAFWNLPKFIAELDKAGFSARSYEVWYQMELALPLFLASMVLIAAGFTMRHARFGKSGQMVLFAILSGFLIFFLRNFAQVLGVNGQIPVVLAAWAPPAAAVMLAVSLLLHLEDG